MKKNTYSLYYLYGINVLIFISFAVSNFIMKGKQKIWFIFLMLALFSIFETLFIKMNKSLNPKCLFMGDAIKVVLKSIGTTVVLVGSVIFIISIFVK